MSNVTETSPWKVDDLCHLLGIRSMTKQMRSEQAALGYLQRLVRAESRERVVAPGRPGEIAFVQLADGEPEVGERK